MSIDYAGEERRKNWEPCGHHASLKDEVKSSKDQLSIFKKEVRQSLKEINEDIGEIKGDGRAFEERFSTLFNKLSELTAWIKGLVMLMIGALVSFFIWYVQTMGGR